MRLVSLTLAKMFQVQKKIEKLILVCEEPYLSEASPTDTNDSTGAQG